MGISDFMVFLPIIISIQALKRPTLAFTVLMLYSILSGFVFATVAWAYTGASIAAAFVSASAIFITMTTVGLVTNKVWIVGVRRQLPH